MKALIVGLVLVVLGFAATEMPAQKTGMVRIKVDQEKRFAKGPLFVKFVQMVEDSRCPVDTNCVWAGNAKIKIRVRGNGRTHLLTLDTNGPNQAATAEGYSLKLTGLIPEPRSNIRINRSGYVASLEIVKLKR